MSNRRFMDNMSRALSITGSDTLAVEKSTGDMDNTSADAVEATRAGLSYGQWKALHPNTKAMREAAKEIRKKEKPGNEIICKNCGRAFVPARQGTKVKYCSDECRTEANNRMYRERNKRRRAEKGGQQNGMLQLEN